MKKGPYEILESKKIYENPWITVREDSVQRPDGEKGIFGIVDYSPGVHIFAIDQAKNVILIKEYMYALERDDLMFPAGGIEKNEHPLDAAKRELLEESGYTSENWIELGVVNPMTMIIKSPYHIYLALDCELVSSHEASIKVQKQSIEEVEKMIGNGTITLAGSICSFYLAQKHLK